MHDTEGIAQLFSHKNQILCWTESAPSVDSHVSVREMFQAKLSPKL